MGTDTLPHDKKGSKTNISYYHKIGVDAICEMDNYNFIFDLDYIVHKTKYLMFLEREREREREREIPERVALFPDFTNVCVFDGHFSMLWIIVLDLLMFNVKEIKIYHANFRLDAVAYENGYDTINNLIYQKEIEYNSMCSLHARLDLITQISMVRNLYIAGLCKVDKELENILALSNEEIMGLYEKYIPYTWKHNTTDFES